MYLIIKWPVCFFGVFFTNNINFIFILIYINIHVIIKIIKKHYLFFFFLNVFSLKDLGGVTYTPQFDWAWRFWATARTDECECDSVAGVREGWHFEGHSG